MTYDTSNAYILSAHKYVHFKLSYQYLLVKPTHSTKALYISNHSLMGSPTKYNAYCTNLLFLMSYLLLHDHVYNTILPQFVTLA